MGWLRLLVVSCGALAAAAGSQDVRNARIIDKGAMSNVDDAMQATARTAAEWAALWKKHNYDKPAPPVDFSKELVVAVFMGSRPTAGFAVDIVRAEESEGKLLVGYTETSPKPGTVSAQVLTAPYCIAAVPKSALPVVFTRLKTP